MLASFDFDVALSFAGEDRVYVDAVAQALRKEGIRVFYDEFVSAELWGADLYVLFDEVFRKKSRYVVAFVSKHYVAKPWPSHERRSAQARALFEAAPFLLPVQLDDSELPGLPPTVGYVDARKTDTSALVTLIMEKVGVGSVHGPASPTIERVPRSVEEEALLLATRPGGWEYLLFAAVLRRQKTLLEPKWHDHELGYVQPQGKALSDADAFELVSGAYPHAVAIISNVTRLLSPQALELAFGAPGEPGDPQRIEHIARRLVDVYDALLEWSFGLQGAIVPGRFARLVELSSRMVDGPIRQVREYVDKTVAEVDRVPAILRRENREPTVIKLELVLAIDNDLVPELERELQRLGAELAKDRRG